MLLWQLEERLWARRSYRQIVRLNREALASVPERRLPFGAEPHQYLLWFPAQPGVTPKRNLVMFLHGGGWQGGSPEYHRFIGLCLSRLGFTTAVPGYRPAPAYRFPAQLDDVFDALQLVRHLAADRGPGGRVIMVGHSAGAHLGALAAFAHAAFAPQRALGGFCAGVVSLGGPLDFARCRNGRLRAMIRALVGPGVDPAVADPSRYVAGAGGTPVLCVHGRKDWLVEPDNSRAFVARAGRAGSGPAELLILPDAHHADLVELFYRPSPASAQLRAWLDRREPRASR